MTTITPQYIDPPKAGKKQWSVKDQTGQYYGAFADVANQMKVGGTYEITTESRVFNGVTYHTIKTVKQVSAPAPNGAGTGGSYNTYRKTDPVDAERMMVTALVKAAVQAGTVAVEANNLANAINQVRQAWNMTYGAGASRQAQQQPRPTPSQDMNDEIGF